jgi:hypothetical protein
MDWQPTFEELQEAIIAESTFAISYVEAWAFRGAWPPPLHGNPASPISAFLHLSVSDLWDLEGPSVSVSDDQGVELLRAAANERVRAAVPELRLAELSAS